MPMRGEEASLMREATVTWQKADGGRVGGRIGWHNPRRALSNGINRIITTPATMARLDYTRYYHA